jgi:hypothetical protein
MTIVLKKQLSRMSDECDCVSNGLSMWTLVLLLNYELAYIAIKYYLEN